MTRKQRLVLEGLRARVQSRTCRIKSAEIVKCETEDRGRGRWLFHIRAEVSCFEGVAIGLIGPRGGVTLTHERYEVY